MKKLKKRIGGFKETHGIAHQAIHQFSIQMYNSIMLNFVDTLTHILRD